MKLMTISSNHCFYLHLTLFQVSSKIALQPGPLSTMLRHHLAEYSATAGSIVVESGGDATPRLLRIYFAPQMICNKALSIKIIVQALQELEEQILNAKRDEDLLAIIKE